MAILRLSVLLLAVLRTAPATPSIVQSATLLVPRVQEVANASSPSDFFNSTLASEIHASWSAMSNRTASNNGKPKKKWWKAFRKDDEEKEKEEEEEKDDLKTESWQHWRKKRAAKNLKRRQAAARLREARKGQQDLVSDSERKALERWSDRMEGKKVKRPPRKVTPKEPGVSHSAKSLRGFGGGGGAGEVGPEERSPAREVQAASNGFESNSTSSHATRTTTEAPAKESNSSWSFPVPWSTASSKPRVHFLFMVGDSLPHSDQWNAFFADGEAEGWSAFVHCKSGCSSSFMATVPGFKAVDMVETFYCHDLVTAMVQLLRFASKDEGHANDKFVFLSDSTLPVKPFAEVYDTLLEHEESDFCIFPSDHWGEADFNNKRAYLVKHQQWVVLNREHAELMVKNWGSVDSNGRWAVPIRNQVDYSPESVYNASHFSRSPMANWCTDEWAFFATIFGAQVDDGSMTKSIPGFTGRHGSELVMRGHNVNKMQGTCRTFAFFSETDDEMTDLAKTLAQDFPHSYLSCWPVCHAHPTRIERLSDGGLLEMRRSPFLFVRKFSSGLELRRFKDIILASDPPDDITPAAAYPSPPEDRNVSHHDWDLIDDANDASYAYNTYG